MRRVSWFRLFLYTSAALPAAAQQTMGTSPCTLGMTHFVNYGIDQSVVGKPFTATAKTTFDQKLSDGNVIHGMATVHEARDSAGRSRVEMAEGCDRGEDGKLYTRVLVTVTDPAKNISMMWWLSTIPRPVVDLQHFPAPTPAPERLAESKQKEQMLNQRLNPSPQESSRVEDLGSKDVGGVLAHGKRTTHTIPTGQEGNELPLVLVNEVWNSRDLGIVLAITDDPRSGKVTYELDDITFGEPDPSLFAPPEGYKIRDVNPPTQGPIQSEH